MESAVRAELGEIAGYTIDGQLRQGGDGVTYRARETSTGRRVVIKAPREDHDRTLDAFAGEIATLQLLNRARVRGVVELVGFGTAGRRPWYAMSWIDGCDLAAHIDQVWMRAWWAPPARQGSGERETVEILNDGERSRGSSLLAEAESVALAAAPTDGLDEQTLRNALRLIGGIAAILADVHAQGVLHGDLSPNNIMLGLDHAPTLLDFGAALTVFEPGKAREVATIARGRRATPGYAAPEVYAHQLLDSRCDIYSLGCIAYELLMGRPLFSAVDRDALVRQHLHRAPEFPAAASQLPDGVSLLIRRMLEKDRTRRVPHALEVAEAFNHWAGDPRPVVAASPSVGVFRPRLAGRQRVLAGVRRMVGDAGDGRGGLVLLRGASGQGKTRLLNEIGFEAERAGVEVVVCRCIQAPAATGSAAATLASGLELFAPVFERTAALVNNGVLAADAEPLRQALASLDSYSPVRLVAPGSSGLPEVSAAAAIQRVVRGLATLLEHLARVKPFVLLLDDLQWADELSSQFLCGTTMDFSQLPIVIVCATRDRIGGIELEALRARCGVDEVLSSLSRNDVSDVAKDLLGVDALPEGLLDFLARVSEGTPFFIAEYTRAALRENWLRRERGGRWSFAAPQGPSTRLDLSRALDSMFVERTRELSPMAADALKFAVVLGREFDGADLFALAGDRAASRATLGELVAREILLQTGPDQYRFSHDAIRDANERALAPTERSRLHRQAAEVISRKTFPKELQRLARLGQHWAAAGQPDVAFELLERAAFEALRDNSPSLAHELLKSAHEQCELAEGSSSIKLSQLAESLGDALIRLARHAEARVRYRQALRAPAGGSLTVARLWRKLAASCFTLHEYTEAAEALDQAERALGPPQEFGPEHDEERIQIKLGRAEHLYYSQAKGRALESLLTELSTLVDARGTEIQKNTYYVAACSYLMFRNRYALSGDILNLAERATLTARTLEIEARAQAHFIHAFALTLGSPEQCRQALPQFERAWKAADAALATTLQARIATYRAIAALRLGDVEATLAAVVLARTAAEAAQQTPYLAIARACLGWAAWRRGEEPGRRLLEEARQMWLTHSHPFPMRWIATIPLLAFALADDAFDTCKAYLDDLLDAGQCALPGELTAAIRRAAAACARETPRVAAAETERALLLARELGYG